MRILSKIAKIYSILCGIQPKLCDVTKLCDVMQISSETMWFYDDLRDFYEFKWNYVVMLYLDFKKFLGTYANLSGFKQIYAEFIDFLLLSTK